MDMSEKIRRKRLLRCFWQKINSWWGKNTARSFDLCSGVGIVWSITTRTRVSDVTSVTLFVKCFNPLKLYPLSGNIFRKWFASYFLFIHELLMIMWSPTVNLNAVTTLLLTSSLHRCKQRIFKKNTIVFINISLVILSEIFIQVDYFFSELCKKTKVGDCFLHTVYKCR